METFRNKLKFVLHKLTHTHSLVLPAARKQRVALCFLSRWRAQQLIHIPALLPKLPRYPAFSNTCCKIFHTCSVSLKVQGGKDIGTIKGCAQQCTWYFQNEPSPPSLCYLQKGICSMDAIQGTAAAVQVLTPHIRCKQADLRFLWPAFLLGFSYSWYLKTFWIWSADAAAHK